MVCVPINTVRNVFMLWKTSNFVNKKFFKSFFFFAQLMISSCHVIHFMDIMKQYFNFSVHDQLRDKRMNIEIEFQS